MSDSLIVKCIIVHYFDMSWNKAYIVAINQYYNVFGQVPELTYARGWLLHVYFIKAAFSGLASSRWKKPWRCLFKITHAKLRRA